MIVFVVSGLWHGAAYTFLIWGALHGLLMVLERMLYGPHIKQLSDRITVGNLLRISLTFVLVNFAWIFFRAETWNDSIQIINKICTDYGKLWLDMDTLSIAFMSLMIVFVVDICEEGRIPVKLYNSKHKFVRYLTVVSLISYILLFGVLNNGSFIYFQF